MRPLPLKILNNELRLIFFCSRSVEVNELLCSGENEA